MLRSSQIPRDNIMAWMNAIGMILTALPVSTEPTLFTHIPHADGTYKIVSNVVINRILIVLLRDLSYSLPSRMATG